MTPSEINRAIAEHLGWKNLPLSDECWPPSLNYVTDLNAMHEAEKTLENVAPIVGVPCKSLYMQELNKIVHYGWEYTHATSAQRAEAFLRTIGKWKD